MYSDLYASGRVLANPKILGIQVASKLLFTDRAVNEFGIDRYRCHKVCHLWFLYIFHSMLTGNDASYVKTWYQFDSNCYWIDQDYSREKSSIYLQYTLARRQSRQPSPIHYRCLYISLCILCLINGTRHFPSACVFLLHMSLRLCNISTCTKWLSLYCFASNLSFKR